MSKPHEDITVTVLMSTYNGEDYVEEQVRSILDQSFTGMITILVRDDGSSDGTIETIEKIETGLNRKIILQKAANVGPQRSFLQLMKEAVSADYYFFSDQDDIWSIHKIETAVLKMETCSEEPCCYCSNYDLLFSETGTVKRNVLQQKPVFRPLRTLFYNQIPGCTMGFNELLMELIRKVSLTDVMMHDSMVLSLCAAAGIVLYDENAQILHRIHNSNVVGEGHKKIVPHRWIVEKAKLLFKKEPYDVSEMADQFLKTGAVREQYVADLELLRDFKKNCKNTIRMLRHPDSRGKRFDRTTMSIRCKILFHIF